MIENKKIIGRQMTYSQRLILEMETAFRSGQTLRVYNFCAPESDKKEEVQTLQNKGKIITFQDLMNHLDFYNIEYEEEEDEGRCESCGDTHGEHSLEFKLNDKNFETSYDSGNTSGYNPFNMITGGFINNLLYGREDFINRILKELNIEG